MPSWSQVLPVEFMMDSKPRVFAGILLIIFLGWSSVTGQPPATQENASAANKADFFGMKIDSGRRTLTVPVEVNMSGGFIEYILVHESGKTHESLFRCSISGEKFNAAVLLFLPAKKEHGVKLFHDVPIQIAVSGIDSDGKPFKSPVDRWVQNSVLELPMSPGPWGYVGSRFEENVFVAARDGSFIAVREDSDAILGNPRPERIQDDIWKAAVPPPFKAGDKLSLILEFPRQKL